MITLTKRVTCKYGNAPYADWWELMVAKAAIMAAQGLTDGVHFDGGQGTGLGGGYCFVDQAAAEQWVDFVQATAAQQNRPIISIEITDV